MIKKSILGVLCGTVMFSFCFIIGEADENVMSYEEYMAADLDALVTVDTYVQAKQSFWENSATVYTQDEDGAYFLYNMDCSEEDYEKLELGTKIRVTGYKSEWSGEIEIVDATFEFVDDGESFIAEPLDVSSLLGTDELINHQNEFVSFTGMTVVASEDADGNESAFLYSWDGSGEDGDDLYFNVSYGGNTYTFTVESYLCDNTTEVYQAVTALNIGDVIDMEGFLYWYEGLNPHITSVAESSGNAGDIESNEVVGETEFETETEKEAESSGPAFKTFYWGDSKETVIASEGEPAMEEELTTYLNSEYIAYETTVAGLDAVLAYYFCDEGLFKVRYIITESHTTDSLYVDDYETLVKGITSKYGDPLYDYDDWESDSKKEYYSGREGTALVYGYLEKTAIWSLDDTYIMVNASADNYDVDMRVDYESKTVWPGTTDYSSDF